MSNLNDNPFVSSMEEVRDSWGWFLALGIVLVVLGVGCIAYDVIATFTAVVVFGWLLLISGVFALVQAFTIGTWSGFFLYLFGALLRGFTGYLLLRHPVIGAESLTLVLGSFFIVGGLFRAIGSGMARFPRWGWGVFSGVLSVVLGILVLWQMPITGVWFIGFAIGLDMIVDCVAVASFASAIHHLPGRTAPQAA